MVQSKLVVPFKFTPPITTIDAGGIGNNKCPEWTLKIYLIKILLKLLCVTYELRTRESMLTQG